MPESMKKQLLKMREELLKDLNQDVRSERTDFDTEVGDFYDNADTERGRQLFHLLSGREREKLMPLMKPWCASRTAPMESAMNAEKRSTRNG